jgi:hypothetical protein
VQRSQGGAVPLDEGAGRSSSRQRLDAQATAAGEEIEADVPGERAAIGDPICAGPDLGKGEEDIEHGFPHPV